MYASIYKHILVYASILLEYDGISKHMLEYPGASQPEPVRATFPETDRPKCQRENILLLIRKNATSASIVWGSTFQGFEMFF